MNYTFIAYCLHLKSQEFMGFPAARVGDMHVCSMVTPGMPSIPHIGGPILPPGIPTVLIGGMPAAVVGDMCICVGQPDSIVKGSLGVLIGGRPAARIGDITAHGGTIVMGCPTVLIGDVANINNGSKFKDFLILILNELLSKTMNSNSNKDLEVIDDLALKIKEAIFTAKSIYDLPGALKEIIEVVSEDYTPARYKKAYKMVKNIFSPINTKKDPNIVKNAKIGYVFAVLDSNFPDLLLNEFPLQLQRSFKIWDDLHGAINNGRTWKEEFKHFAKENEGLSFSEFIQKDESYQLMKKIYITPLQVADNLLGNAVSNAVSVFQGGDPIDDNIRKFESLDNLLGNPIANTVSAIKRGNLIDENIKKFDKAWHAIKSLLQ